MLLRGQDIYSSQDEVTTLPKIRKQKGKLKKTLKIRNQKKLNELVKKDVVFLWQEKHNLAFQKLKQKLTQAPVLALPDFNQTFELQCDASGISIGAVLLQGDHCRHPISSGGIQTKKWTLSLMKYLSILMCLVLSCCTGLWAMLMADLLSQYSCTGLSTLTLRSSKMIARVSLIQEQISAVGSDLETIKSEEAHLRDQFFHNMLHLNASIRFIANFQESIITYDIEAVDCAASRDAPKVILKENDAEVALRALESTLLEVICQTAKVDEEYQAEQKNYKNVQQQLFDYERKVSLMSMIVMETKELQDLTIYPYKYLTSSFVLMVSAS
uniref:Reverse transcriptase/retrotransposon-derived protein RNase H-like domain-containing protein n=1 Tax=Cajanus cajan TaxID=3821 RepID=A0A151QTC6_CAJCA|nr:hypothetical protein KK1_045571 [Cajanus cajan]